VLRIKYMNCHHLLFESAKVMECKGTKNICKDKGIKTKIKQKIVP